MLKRTIFLIVSLPSIVFAGGEVPSPNMSLPVPTVGVTTGPSYAADINNSLGIIDSHNHTAGQGVPIPPAGLNINSDLTVQGNNLTHDRSLRFSPQTSPISGTADIGAVYESGVDLYYNDGSGNQIRLTQSGGLAGTPGSISNLTSPASAAFVSATGTFVWSQGSSVAGNMDAGTYILRYPGSYPTPSGFYIALQAPTSLATGYSLTFPSSLPGSQSFATIDSSGNIGTSIPVSGGITRANMSTPGLQQSSGNNFSTSAGTLVNSGASVTLTTSGNPVLIVIDGQFFATHSGMGALGMSIGYGVNGSYYGLINQASAYDNTGGLSLNFPVGGSAFVVIGAGTYTFQIYVGSFSGAVTAYMNGGVISAYEIK